MEAGDYFDETGVVKGQLEINGAEDSVPNCIRMRAYEVRSKAASASSYHSLSHLLRYV